MLDILSLITRKVRCDLCGKREAPRPTRAVRRLRQINIHIPDICDVCRNIMLTAVMSMNKKAKEKELDDMTAFQFLKQLRNDTHLPMSTEGLGEASNSEIRRWLTKHNVIINSKTPGPDEGIEFPITQLFFPKGKRRST